MIPCFSRRTARPSPKRGTKLPNWWPAYAKAIGWLPGQSFIATEHLSQVTGIARCYFEAQLSRKPLVELDQSRGDYRYRIRRRVERSR